MNRKVHGINQPRLTSELTEVGRGFNILSLSELFYSTCKWGRRARRDDPLRGCLCQNPNINIYYTAKRSSLIDSRPLSGVKLETFKEHLIIHSVPECNARISRESARTSLPGNPNFRTTRQTSTTPIMKARAFQGSGFLLSAFHAACMS